jgi:trigger factor
VNITSENIAPLHLRLNVNLTPDDYLAKVDSGIKELSKKIAMPGFRPGKVPVSLSRKMYGNQVLADELDKILNESVTTYIKENNLEIFGQPLPSRTENMVIDIANPSEYNFGFEVGLVPSFQIAALDTHSFEKEACLVTDDMINEEIDKITMRYGKEEDIEKPEGDDNIILAEFDELDEQGAVKEGGVSNRTSFLLRVVKDESVKQEMLNLKKDDSIQIDINKTFGHDHNLIIHNLLNTDHARADLMSPMFRLLIHGVKRVLRAELNQDLFDKAYGASQIDSEDALRARLRAQLEKEFNRVGAVRLENAIHKYLIDNTSIDFPEAFLKNWVQANNAEGKQQDEVSDEEFRMIIERLKWDLIVNKLTKEWNLQVNIEDIRQAVKNEIISRYFGGSADDSMNELVERLADSMLKEEKSIRRYTEMALYDKVFSHATSLIKTNEVVKSYHDFVHQH